MNPVQPNFPQFFTATGLQGKPLPSQDHYKKIVIGSLRFLVHAQRIKIFCFVIMPNHLHLLWQMQPPHERQDVQRDFLKFSAQKIKYDLTENDLLKLKSYEVNAKDRAYQFWERRPLSIDVYRPKIFMQKLNYIHNNPVQPKWRLCRVPEAYKYSSAAFYECGDDHWDFLTHYNE